jgi:hypothetical protein
MYIKSDDVTPVKKHYPVSTRILWFPHFNSQLVSHQFHRPGQQGPVMEVRPGRLSNTHHHVNFGNHIADGRRKSQGQLNGRFHNQTPYKGRATLTNE